MKIGSVCHSTECHSTEKQEKIFSVLLQIWQLKKEKIKLLEVSGIY